MSTKKILNFLLMCFGLMAIVYVGASIVNADFTMRSWSEDTRGVVGSLIAISFMGSIVISFLWEDE